MAYTGKRDPINCPANQPVLKPTPNSGCDWMEDNPTTTGKEDCERCDENGVEAVEESGGGISYQPCDHHPSCRKSDKDLVWHCSQCGLNESAADIENQLDAMKEAARSVIDGWDGNARMGPRIEKLRESIGEKR